MAYKIQQNGNSNLKHECVCQNTLNLFKQLIFNVSEEIYYDKTHPRGAMTFPSGHVSPAWLPLHHLRLSSSFLISIA